MEHPRRSPSFCKFLLLFATLGSLGVVACAGMTGGGFGGPIATNADNSGNNLKTANSSDGNSLDGNSIGDDGFDSVWSDQTPPDDGTFDLSDDTGADYQVGAADPMSGGFADPEQTTMRKVKVYFNKLTILCVDKQDHKVKIKMEGQLKTKSGDERVFRIVDKSSSQYLDTQTHQDQGGYVSFVIMTRPSLPLKFFLLPKDYPVGALDTLLPCENGACVKAGKKPIYVYPFMMDPSYDPKHVNGPECPHVEKALQVESPSSTPILVPQN